MSDASSAGIARGTPGCGKTCRKDVRGRVDVPVMPGAAGRARPGPGGQAQRGEQVPARRAGLRAWVPAVDDNQLTPVPPALVGELTAELAPAAVRDDPGQAPVLHQVLDCEILDHDHVAAPGQPGADTVQEVLPGVADLAVGAGDLR